MQIKCRFQNLNNFIKNNFIKNNFIKNNFIKNNKTILNLYKDSFYFNKFHCMIDFVWITK
jgi:hypothetical protein